MPGTLDDLPRSPTGRVPRWVQDQAAGRDVTPVPWRAATTGATAGAATTGATAGAATGSVRPRRRRRLLALGAVALIGGGWWLWSDAEPQALLTALLRAGEAVTVQPTSPGLPAPEDRWYPAPGFEEQPDRLADASVVVAHDGRYAFRMTQPSDAGSPVAWSPCRPIHYVVNDEGAPDGFVEAVRSTFDEVSAVTGLVFVDDGTTTERPTKTREVFQPESYGDRWAPVLVAVADSSTIADFAAVAGLAWNQPVEDPTTGLQHTVSGWVYLDRGLGDLVWGEERAYVRVLRHELGHLVGLDHIDDPSQIMYAATSEVTGFQPGDLAGMAALGRGACAPGL